MGPLNFLCAPGHPGIVRWRYLDITCPIYLNRLHGKIRFTECFSIKFGFKSGKKVAILEHFSDPIGKVLFSLALPDELQYSFPLWDGGSKVTGISCTDFFKTMRVPELDKTGYVTRKRGIGETGFYMYARPLEYNGRLYFEADFNTARSIKWHKKNSTDSMLD